MAIEWINSDRGSAIRCRVATGLSMEVCHDGISTKSGPPCKWKVVVFGATLQARFETANEAKTAAEFAAKRWLKKGLAAFE